jgi:ribosomal protein L23
MKSINTIIKLIKFSALSSKNIKLIKLNKFNFFIDLKLIKNNIKYFFNIVFNIKIKKINICTLPKKNRTINNYSGFIPNYKKCYLTFYKKSDLINFLKFINYLKLY